VLYKVSRVTFHKNNFVVVVVVAVAVVVAIVVVVVNVVDVFVVVVARSIRCRVSLLKRVSYSSNHASL